MGIHFGSKSIQQHTIKKALILEQEYLAQFFLAILEQKHYRGKIDSNSRTKNWNSKST
jgi:hypothetical protein